jgi:outer membrane protein OmpA-like peptidoglycan-associated protein
LMMLTVIAAIVTNAGCASAPPANPLLDNARRDLAVVQSSPKSAELASGELRQASDALNKANDAWNGGADVTQVNHLAYLAAQRAAIAQQTVEQKSAERMVNDAAATRDKIRLEARTKEVQAAESSAAAAQRQANDAMRQSDASQQQATQAQARATQLESQMRELNAKQTMRGMVITLGDVLFDAGRDQLKPGAVRNIDQLANFLTQNPKRSVLVEGFTDSTGSASNNQDLSDRRADAVRSALVERGVSRNRIGVYGYGQAFPVTSNDSAASRQMNRRVEVLISEDDGKVTPR